MTLVLKQHAPNLKCRSFVMSVMLLAMACMSLRAQNLASDILDWRGQIDFAATPQTIGKVLAGTNEHCYYLLLGQANFSPELVYPLYAVYHSSSEKDGLLGEHWCIPQLDSCLHEDRWLTPWGENIVFPDIKCRFEKKGTTVWGINNLKGWSFSYEQERLVRIASPYGRAIVFAYNETGQPIAVKQGKQEFIKLDYEGGKLYRLTINGVSMKLEYDAHGRFQSCGIGKLLPNRFEYDEEGHLVKISCGKHEDNLVLKDGRLVQDGFYIYNWLEDGWLEIIDKNGVAAQYRYQNFLLEEKKHDVIQRYVKFLPSGDTAFPGKIVENSRKSGHLLLKYGYDRANRLTSMKMDNGNYLSIERNNAGNVTKIFRQSDAGAPHQPVLRMEYDKQHQPVSCTRLAADGSSYGVTSFIYDKDGQIISVRSPGGTTVLTYEANGYIKGIVRTPGMMTAMKYNEWNQLIVRSNGMRHLNISYNDAGLIHTMREYLGKDMLHDYACTYDANGRLAELYDRKNNVKQNWTYDAQGNCLTSTDGNGNRTEYAYGYDRQLKSVTDPLGHCLNFKWGEYGPAERRTAIGQMLRYTYNSLGLLETETAILDGNEKPDRAIRIQYDDICRPIRWSTDDGFEIKTAYDEWGNRASQENVNPETYEIRRTLYEHDEFGREVVRTDIALRNGKEIECTVLHTEYDIADRRTKIVLQQGETQTSLGKAEELTWDYDMLGRIVCMKSSGGHVISYEYGKDGKLAKRTVDGLDTRFRFNGHGQLESVMTGTDCAVLYDYDGDILAGMTVNGMQKSYRYDKVGQLLSVNEGVGGKLLEEYNYDKAGNIVSQKVGLQRLSMEYDAANQLIKVDGGENTEASKRFEYDAAGRMVRNGNLGIRYGWYNSPVNVEEQDGEAHEYAYYADGHLAKADDVSYVWDGLALLHRGTDLCVNEPGSQGGNPLVMGNRKLVTDHLGTTLSIFDGTERRDISRSAFGRNTSENSDDDVDFFTGKPMVAGLGHAFLLRQYLADYGRWSSADPLGYPDGWNPYVYCGNEVMSLVDPNGGHPAAVAVIAGAYVLAVSAINAAAQIYQNNKNGEVWHKDVLKAAVIGAVSGVEGILIVAVSVFMPEVAPEVIPIILLAGAGIKTNIKYWGEEVPLDVYGGEFAKTALWDSLTTIIGQAIGSLIGPCVDFIKDLASSFISEVLVQMLKDLKDVDYEELFKELCEKIEDILYEVEQMGGNDQSEQLDGDRFEIPGFSPMRLIFE